MKEMERPREKGEKGRKAESGKKLFWVGKISKFIEMPVQKKKKKFPLHFAHKVFHFPPFYFLLLIC